MPDITVTLLEIKKVFMHGQWVDVKVYSPASQVTHTFNKTVKVKGGRRRADSIRMR